MSLTLLDPKSAADQVLAGLRNVCPPQVKGAHDADFCLCDGKAYLVYEANDVQPGENPYWPFVYCALAVIDLATLAVEQTIIFAVPEQRFANASLPPGACFVPRILPKDDRTLRVFFTSEEPGKRQSQTWRLDFDIPDRRFASEIYPMELATSEGVFPMQPQFFYRQAVAEGFTHPEQDYGLYLVDSFKSFDGRWHAVLNNFPIGQNAWAELNPEMTRMTVRGNLFQPTEARLTEAAVNRLPDGEWLAILRRDDGDKNYRFARSSDGLHWDPAELWPMVTNGTNSKPTLDYLNGVYYLGWQEATRINGMPRSVFNLEVSEDGRQWERGYRFESSQSFQYPIFREADGVIYVAATRGDCAADPKERIVFGRLEPLAS